MCPIDFRWEETYRYTPTTLPRSRSPHNVLHSPRYIYRTSKRPRGSEFVTRGGAGRPIPYAVRACCGAGPRPTSRPTVVDVGRETRQPIRATSRDRLSSDSLEEMEARLMSRAARMLISRATVLPGACVCW